jgi:hypothetical protein
MALKDSLAVNYLQFSQQLTTVVATKTQEQ